MTPDDSGMITIHIGALTGPFFRDCRRKSVHNEIVYYKSLCLWHISHATSCTDNNIRHDDFLISRAGDRFRFLKKILWINALLPFCFMNRLASDIEKFSRKPKHSATGKQQRFSFFPP
jgi:hypothetical protein